MAKTPGPSYIKIKLRFPYRSLKMFSKANFKLMVKNSLKLVPKFTLTQD